MTRTTPLNRRPALAVAAAVAIFVGAGIAALAANLGLLGTTSAASDKVGKLDGVSVEQLISSTGDATTTTVPSATAPTRSTSGSSSGSSGKSGSGDSNDRVTDQDHDADD